MREEIEEIALKTKFEFNINKIEMPMVPEGSEGQQLSDLLKQNAPTLTKVCLLQPGEVPLMNNVVAPLLEAIFGRSKNLLEIDLPSKKLNQLCAKNRKAAEDLLNWVPVMAGSITIKDCEKCRDRLPAMRQIFVQTNQYPDVATAHKVFIDRLKLLTAASHKYGVDLLRDIATDANHTLKNLASLVEKKIVPEKAKVGRPEKVPRIQPKSIVSPHELRERLKQRSGVTLGLVKSFEGASR